MKNETTKNTIDKEDPNNLETVLKELPQLLVNHAYKKLKSGEDFFDLTRFRRGKSERYTRI